MKTPLFTGCAAALVTPFKHDGSIDEDALVRLIDMQKLAAMDAIVILGTTGEASTLTFKEREQVIALSIEAIDNSMPVIVGTGANDTRKAIEFTLQAHELGAGGVLSVTPYYNKATQSGLIKHYTLIADCCALPLMLYNVPARTGMQIHPETAKELSTHPGIIGIKEASGDASLSAEILQKTGGNLPVYAGNDDLILPLMAQGAVGAISVTANILPSQVRALTHACLNECYKEARFAQEALLPLIRLLFSQVNPIPIKAALAAMKLIDDALRLPLTPMEEPYRSKLLNMLLQLKLIDED